MWRWYRYTLEALLMQGLLVAPLPALAVTSNDTSPVPVRGAPNAVTIDPAATMAHIGATDLYLETTINGRDAGLAHFGSRDEKLLATHATLRLLGFVLPSGLPDPVQLTQLPGLVVVYDPTRQRITLMAPLALLKPSSRVLHAPRTAPPKATSSPGLLLNYHLYGTRANNGNGSLSTYSELRAFNRYGVFSNTALTQRIGTHGRWRTRSVRLDTSWSMSFPQRMLTVRLGDTVTGMASWSRPVRLAGIQLGTDFTLQPYRITTPLAEFIGRATLPSQVELYINGIKRYDNKVPSGQFQLNTVPGITGAGQARMVLTNVLGQVTSVDFALYGTPQLLQKGLSDWSLATGMVRRNYGLASFDYARHPVASGTWRHGVSNTLTASVHGESAQGLFNAGAGADWLLGTAGVVSAAWAESGDRDMHGSQWSLGYRWNNRHFNIAVQGTSASNGYRDIASRYGLPPPVFSGSAQAGFSTSQLGSLSLGYVHLRMQHAEASRYASLWWFKSLGAGTSLSLNINQNLDHARDRSLFLSFSMPLDDRTYLSTGLRHQGDSNQLTAQASRSIPSQGGLGWRVQTQQGGRIHAGQAELDYLGRHGRVRAGISDYAGNSNLFASADGSLVLMGGDVFAARNIYNGFAVVSTNGLPHVPVKLENNLVGRTNGRGLLLVTKLNAYQRNKISIDPMQLPADVRVRKIDLNVTPTDRAGTLVRFDIETVRAATILLVGAGGKPLPLGSRVRLRGHQGQPVPVGFGGMVYLDTLDTHNVLEVILPDGHGCSAAFDYRKRGDGIPRIGPLICIAEASP